MTYFEKKLIGNIVPVPSFYKENLDIDLNKLRKFLEFQIKFNIKNFYLAMAASEFEYMSENERLKITKFVSDFIPKDCVLISQPIGSGSIHSQIEEGMKMIDAGSDALVIKPQSLKENANFFSSKYLNRSYSSNKHDDFFINYIDQFAGRIKKPLIYHDHPFSNGLGLPLKTIKILIKNKYLKGFKVHTPDPGHLREQYNFINDNNLASFDGFGKTLQFWTLQWGATARHSCWSWFEPEVDNLFFNYMKEKNFSKAVNIINRESPIVKVIRMTGYPGYKYLMQLSGLPASKSRIPGESLNLKVKITIKEAYKSLKKIIIN